MRINVNTMPRSFILPCFFSPVFDLLLLSLLPPSFLCFRPVRQGVSDMWREKAKKEEDLDQEEHAEPHVQRGAGVRHSQRKHRKCVHHHRSDGLRLVSAVTVAARRLCIQSKLITTIKCLFMEGVFSICSMMLTLGRRSMMMLQLCWTWWRLPEESPPWWMIPVLHRWAAHEFMLMVKMCSQYLSHGCLQQHLAVFLCLCTNAPPPSLLSAHCLASLQVHTFVCLPAHADTKLSSSELLLRTFSQGWTLFLLSRLIIETLFSFFFYLLCLPLCVCFFPFLSSFSHPCFHAWPSASVITRLLGCVVWAATLTVPGGSTGRPCWPIHVNQ